MKVSVAPLLKQSVGDHMDLHVQESPVDPRGDNAGLLDADITAFDADIKATHTDPGAYLEGGVRAEVAQQCVRCLRPIHSPVAARFAEQYYATERVETGAPMPSAPRDAKTIGSDFLIDLTPLIREEVILATPQAPLCRPGCRGLCPVCGEDLNERPHDHEPAPDARWAALEKLKDVKD
ncbi:MAG: DUF177 domain-containing protein [Chloroflexota bacterium]|nr:DUF177 domain-containing protein [Chloroflexota bacterium]MDE3192225.1 DUF177 domain-containing protein [Chloroflexota bacterium]